MWRRGLRSGELIRLRGANNQRRSWEEGGGKVDPDRKKRSLILIGKKRDKQQKGRGIKIRMSPYLTMLEGGKSLTNPGGNDRKE